MTDIPNMFLTYLLFDEVLFYIVTNKRKIFRVDYVSNHTLLVLKEKAYVTTLKTMCRR
jgi:hypothetical protein